MDSLALAFIRSSKDRLLTPDSLRAKLDASFAPLPLAELGWSIYADYQRALAYRGAVDFDDLIRLALTLLQNDEEYLERLRFRYPFILEDEAQDSSRTQQKILSLLSGGSGRETPPLRMAGIGCALETQIKPSLKRSQPLTLNYCASLFETNPNADMPESGRSQPAVIALANHLIDWVMTAHPDPNVRTALSLPHIEPVPEGYEPVNPPDNPEGIKFISKKFTPEDELEAVAKSVKSYLDLFADSPHEEKPTIAVLVPRNQRGVEVVESLRKRGVEAIELISSTANTRAAAGSLNYLLSYLADPQSARKLSKAYEVWRRDWRVSPSLRGTKQSPVAEVNANDEGIASTEERRLAMTSSDEEIASQSALATTSQTQLLATTSNLLRRLIDVENFIAPNQADDWLTIISESEAFASHRGIKRISSQCPALVECGHASH